MPASYFLSINLQFSFSTRNSHASRPPNIFYYEGLSVLVDFTVSRLLDDLSGPSVSLNMAFFAANQSFAEEQNFRTSTVSTINDELTPGVFETNYVYLNEKTSTVQLPNSSQLPPAFVQWHPVFYADPSPELKSSRHVVTSAQTPPTPSALSSVHSSVAYALLGDRLRKGPRPVAWRLQNFTFADSASSTYITCTLGCNLPFLTDRGHSSEERTAMVGDVVLWSVLGVSVLAVGQVGLFFGVSEQEADYVYGWSLEECSASDLDVAV
ncbi:unnamed protein product [Schistocephalus solidus]|uniref:Similar to n=1 Tax=Schistocephalus solidus TaxID=70667 RepID=A0A183TRW1_SCHSO|nr:unnamed protein product [Schistocephalus solidus]